MVFLISQPCIPSGEGFKACPDLKCCCEVTSEWREDEKLWKVYSADMFGEVEYQDRRALRIDTEALKQEIAGLTRKLIAPDQFVLTRALNGTFDILSKSVRR